MIDFYYLVFGNLESPRASSIQILKTCDALSRHDVNVTLVLPYEQRLDAFSGDHRFTIRALTKHRYSLHALGIVRYWFTLRSIVKQSAASGRTFVLYYRHQQLTIVACLLLVEFSTLRVVYEIHRLSKSRFHYYLESYLVRRGVRTIAISQRLKDLYIERHHGLTSSATSVVHDAVDVRSFSYGIDSLKASPRRTRPVILYVGSLWLVKGVEVLLKAAEQLTEVDVMLTGRQFPDFRDYVARHPVSKNVFIKDAIPHDEVSTLLQSADLLVIPHPDNDLSQSPLKLFEYMASGKPILASRIPQLTEILPEDCLLFEAGDHVDLAQAVRAFLSNKEWYTAQAEHNKEIVKQYSWEERARRIGDVIRSYDSIPLPK